MALLTDFFITAQNGPEPCTIAVSDITPYPYDGLPITEYGVVMFYDIAAFAGAPYTGASLSNMNYYGVPCTWTIPPIGNETVTIQVFVVSIWTNPAPGGWYPVDWVCTYNGQFWHSNGLANHDAVPGVDPVWDIITIGTPADLTQAYTWFYNFCSPLIAMGKNGYVQTTFDINCGNNYTPTLTKISCYNYRMEDLSGLGYVQTITLTAYGSSTVLATYTLDPAISTTVDIDISQWGDGVYNISVSADTGTEEINVGTFRIYEWCSLWACYQRLFQDVMCGAYNPCCNTCDPALIETQKRYRETLNMMSGFVMSIMAYINVEQVYYLGIFGTDDLQDSYVHRVSDMITKAKEISQSCGICNPVSTEGSIDSPCSNCN